MQFSTVTYRERCRSTGEGLLGATVERASCDRRVEKTKLPVTRRQ